MAGPTGEQDWYVSGVFSMSFINLNDTFGDYIDRAGLVPKVNAEENALIPSDAKIDSHGDRHKDGGADEIDVSELSGGLGTAGQVPKTDGAVVIWVNLSHDNLSDVTSDQHHTKYTDAEAQAAINNDADHGSTAPHNYFSADHADLTNVLSDQHHTKYTDAEAQAAINNDADHGSTAPHNYFSGDHADLSNVLSDQHHTKYTDGEAIDAVEAHANIFGETQEIRLVPTDQFLILQNTNTDDGIKFQLASDTEFIIYGEDNSAGVTIKFVSFFPDSQKWIINPDTEIPKGCLKTSSGSVSTTSYTGENLDLPGGEYGFYPQLKTGTDNEPAFWGWNTYDGVGKETALVNDTSYKTRMYLCASENYTAYVQQRYLTSSGEVHWIFIKKEKGEDGKIISVWQAPDHPCFGNGGNPEEVCHPFGNFDESKHELVVINPSKDQVHRIKRHCLDEQGMENGKDFIEAMFELYEVISDEQVKWPDTPVTVGVTSEWSDNPKQPVKKPVKSCPYAKMGKLNAV